MSFYGSTYFQLIDTFYKIAIKNSGKDNKGFYSGALDDYVSQAVGRKGAVQFSTGNRWIQIGKDGENQYAFWHSAPEPNGTSVQSFTPNVALPQGVDEATIEELTPGNFVEVRTIKYDTAGHVSGSAPSYYKIPISETEQDIEDLKEAVGAPAGNGEEATGLFSAIDEANANIGMVTEVANAVRDELGTYSSVFPETGTYRYVDENDMYKDFYSEFGSLDSFRTKVYEDANSTKSFIEGILKIKEDTEDEIKANTTMLVVYGEAIEGQKLQIQALESKIEDLETRLKALENN